MFILGAIGCDTDIATERTTTVKLNKYSIITEAPGLQATREQLERLYQRYHFVVPFASGSRTLEVACGSGLGLKYLSGISTVVTGVDIDNTNIAAARKACNSLTNVSVEQMDAHEIEFGDNCFDLVLLYEAIYYLDRPSQFIAEAHRILSNNGKLVICTVNKDWKDFHPSLYSCSYYNASELRSLLLPYFLNIQLFGGFPVEITGMKSIFFSMIKRAAVKYNLIPDSLALRAYLKRLFIGKTRPLPDSLYDGIAEYHIPTPLKEDDSPQNWKIIYAVATKQDPC